MLYFNYKIIYLHHIAQKSLTPKSEAYDEFYYLFILLFDSRKR